MNWDDGLGQGLGCSRVQEGQSGHRPLWQSPGVYRAWWERAPATKRVGTTESGAFQRVGNWPGWVMSSLGGGELA